ncbi:MAG: hypothetical protein ACFBSG_10030 [Leptolyngbyaceae cyanobacterium]
MKRFVDYQGRQIRLANERLQHILEHPEMDSMEQAIPTALINPEVVKRFRSDTAVYLYYLYREATRVGDKWLCVVVKYLESDAFVITAYLTGKLKPGEPIWPNP